MQRYVSEPSERLDGTYNVSVWNEVARRYEVIERKFTEVQAIERARQLNRDYQEECDELGE